MEPVKTIDLANCRGCRQVSGGAAAWTSSENFCEAVHWCHSGRKNGFDRCVHEKPLVSELIRMRILCSILLGVAVCLTAACQTDTKSLTKKDSVGPAQPLLAPKEGVVKVQHILIAFDGTVVSEKVTRSQVEAEQLAKELLAKTQAGEDFDALVRAHTDDSAPGIYSLANHGVDVMLLQDVMPRSDMVKSFGDVSFQLKVGEVGLAEYNKADSPFGWHIIKRLE